MTDYPYTDAQVRQLDSDLMGWCSNWPSAETVLRTLHQHGYTVKFPEPRFYADQYHGDVWFVEDRQRPAEGHLHARFYGPDAERYARDHAARLNEEVSR